MRSIATIAAALALSSSALAQWSDDFNRPNGAIGGNWNVVSGTWAILNNQGTHTSTTSNTILQHTTATAPNYAATVTVMDVFSNPGTTSYFAAVVIGYGGTDAIQVKLQDQTTTAAGFSNIGIYHKTSATAWGAWTGTGTGFATLSAPVLQGQVKVYFTNGGDTINVDIDTDFNGTPDQSYTKTGVLTIAPNLGTGFAISGWGSVGTYGLFDNWAVGGVLPSDACGTANPLFGTQSGTTVGMTNDGSSTCDATGNDVWYTFTAGVSGGILSLDTCGSAIDTVLSVYTGACGALTEIACNDDTAGSPCAAPASALSVVLTPLQQVLVRLSDKGTAGAFTLNSAYFAVPANDNCSAATPITTAAVNGYTVLATNDGSSSCDATGNDVWYSYTAGATGGLLSLNTCASAMDTVVSIYSGACGALSQIACNDDAAGSPCGAPASAVSALLTPAQTVLIRVSDKGVSGSFTLTPSYIAVPANDACASAAALTTAQATGNTLLATNDGTSSCDATGNDVWFSYTAPAASGTLTLDTCTSAIDAVISVYDVCGGTLLACDDNSAACGSGAARVQLSLNPSQSVLIRVSDKGAGGAFVLNRNFGVPPCNGSSLSTLFATNNSLGTGSCVFFDVNVTNPSGISMSQIDQNTGATAVGTAFTVAIWTRAGTYVGSEQTAVGWTNVANGAGIAAGSNQPSTVDFPDFPLAPGITGFCVVITGATNAYTNGTGTNQFFSNSDLSITLGKSQGTPFSSAPISPRVWNGTLRYNCNPPVVSYCTAGTSTNGCVPAISASGTASASATSGFTINVANVEGQKSGLLFYGIQGRSAAVWGSGSTSFLCVKPPTQRMSLQSSGGTIGLCDGTLTEDWLAWAAAHPAGLGQPFAAGNVVNAQAWYRDPPAVKTTNLSDGLEFTLAP